MIYLEMIKVVNNIYPSNFMKKDLMITCSELNIFVGNQGCGKSTMLKLLQQNHSDLELRLSSDVIINGIDTFYFDSEKDNPRVKDLQLFTSPSGENKGIGYGAALCTHFKSHGEVLESFIINPLLQARDCIIFLDEPESGLSITNQFKMIDAIKKALNNNCQIFIASHCFPLIQEFDVFSLEHNMKMQGTKFIDLVK